MIHWDVAGSSLVFLIAAAIALKDTLSKAASMSRNTPSSSVEEKSVDCRVETRCRAEGRKLKERKERRKTEYH